MRALHVLITAGLLQKSFPRPCTTLRYYNCTELAWYVSMFHTLMISKCVYSVEGWYH